MTHIDSIAGRSAYLDANIFIYTLNGFAPLVPVLTRLFTLIEGGHMQALTSELTLAELLVKPFRDGDQAARCAAPCNCHAVRLRYFPDQ